MNPGKIGDRILFGGDEGTVERWPTDFRMFMCWIFAGWSLQYLTISVRGIPYAIHQHNALNLRTLLMAPIFSVVVACTSGVAWWTIWKSKSSAKAWAIAASLMYVLIFLRQFIIPLRPVWDHHVGALLTGIVGLVAFLRRDGRTDA